MKHDDVLRAFGIAIEDLQKIESLYAYAPVYRFNYIDRDYVLKRTGVRSEPKAIAAWTNYLVAQAIKSVAPVTDFGLNPRSFFSGKNNQQENWVIYPFVKGIPYRGNINQINSAGKLLGRIHAVGMKVNFKLKVNKSVVAIKSEKIKIEIKEVLQKIEQYASTKLKDITETLIFYSQDYLETALPKLLKIDLPLANCSWDYKANNLVYQHGDCTWSGNPTVPRHQTDNSPVLIDPDHAGCIPRIYDLATALLLFHGDLPPAPKRMFTTTEWKVFLEGYKQYVTLTTEENNHWQDLLLCAWIDQALWLLSHFPEGWADSQESRYLFSLLTTDLSQFSLFEEK